MDKIAIISDVHGNITALEAVLKDIKKRRISRIFCLGDSIVKCCHPDLVIDRLRKVCEVILLGNSDYAICRSEVKDRGFWSRVKIGEERATYISQLPIYYEFYMSGHLIRLFHASPYRLDDIYNPMFSNQGTNFSGHEIKNPEDLFQNTAFIGKSDQDPIPDIVGYGHIHTPCVVRYKNKTLFNPGSVGIPVEMMNSDFNDKSNKFSTLASYMIIEGNENEKELDSISFQLVRVPYNIEKELADIVSSDMPNKQMVMRSLRRSSSYYQFCQLGVKFMDEKLKTVKQILKNYDQEHLLYFYEDLTDLEKEMLLDQLLTIDFNQILSLYDDSMKRETLSMNDISPISHFEKEDFSKTELKKYRLIGEDLIRSNSFAVITMAGGQGTRLGYKGPKGTYELDLEPTKKSLFEIMCEDLKRTNQNYEVTLPWYIMTSQDNDKQTKDFFENHEFFGYPKEKIKFFTQGKLPIISVDKKLLLQEPYLVKEASNGNGNVFYSMKQHGILEDLEKNHIQWMHFGGIDNVLLKNIDPLFLGLTVAKQYQVASKSIFKEQPMQKTAVYCKKYNKPAILDYDDITLELSEQKNFNGKYLYREANILSHLMSFDAVEKISNIQLRYHRAYKKNAFVNEEGMKQVPDKANSFKFENFIFDAFSHFDDILLLRVDPSEEFAPIKDFTGIYNPDTAKEKYETYWEIY